MTDSLHTKYRPAAWDDVLGQDATVKSLRRAAQDNRAHSYLFTGPSGTGKTTLARLLASVIAGPQATAANIIEFPASQKSGKEDVQGVITSAGMKGVGKVPTKSVIVDECHRLSAAAWDALLKPVEEPSKHVYWMFCTTEPTKVPKAIVTRCLRYDLKPVNEDLIFKLLVSVVEAEKMDVSDEVLDAIADASGGSPRQALVFLEACLYAETAAEARTLMRTAGHTKETIDLCRFLVGGRGQTWSEAVKLIGAIDAEAESSRIVIVNYIAAVLLKTKDEKKARFLFGLLECFRQPYNSSDKLAPLLYSVASAIGLDR